MNQTLISIILFVIIFSSLIVWASISLMKQVNKDWATLDELKQKADSVSTKEEIEEFHKEFMEKASKICNSHIHVELVKIDAYLRGLYKQFEKYKKLYNETNRN